MRAACRPCPPCLPPWLQALEAAGASMARCRPWLPTALKNELARSRAEVGVGRQALEAAVQVRGTMTTTPRQQAALMLCVPQLGCSMLAERSAHQKRPCTAAAGQLLPLSALACCPAARASTPPGVPRCLWWSWLSRWGCWWRGARRTSVRQMRCLRAAPAVGARALPLPLGAAPGHRRAMLLGGRAHRAAFS